MIFITLTCTIVPLCTILLSFQSSCKAHRDFIQFNHQHHHPTTFQMTQFPSNTSGRTKFSSNSSGKIKSSISSSSTDISNSANNDKAGVYYKSDINTTTNTNHSNTYKKKLILIRHGTSLANEFMDRPGNRWGDKTFTDDMSLVDASLSQTGVSQANMLRQKLSNRFAFPVNGDCDGDRVNGMSDDDNENDVIPVDDNLLVVTSPLRRCIETMTIGVLPNIILTNKNDSNNNHNYNCHGNDDGNSDEQNKQEQPQGVRIVVQPLATERVYTASDTGRPVAELQKDYPHLDFDTCFSQSSSIDRNSWWYTTQDNGDNNDKNNNSTPYQEWRPFGDGQYYAVPGEPVDVFNQRMVDLFQWIKSREERTIILVCHWGVIRWLTGEDVKNCHVKELIFDHLVLKNEVLKSNL